MPSMSWSIILIKKITTYNYIFTKSNLCPVCQSTILPSNLLTDRETGFQKFIPDKILPLEFSMTSLGEGKESRFKSLKIGASHMWK